MKTMFRVQVAVALLVLAATAFGQGVPLDISGGFNMDAWCGPKEYQVLLEYADLYEPDLYLTQVQGGVTEGVGVWIMSQQEFLICNTTAAPGFDEPYSIATTAGHPIWKDGLQGTPQDGILTGAERTYHMASVLGNVTLPGDWTEVADPAAGEGGVASGQGMAVQLNTMCTLSLHNIGTFQIAEAVAELPPGQKGRYNNINFVLAATGQAWRARDMRIYALYGTDGSDEELLYDFGWEIDDDPTILDNGGSGDFQTVYNFAEVYNSGGDPAGRPGRIVETPGSLYEFAQPLPLDSGRILWGIRLADSRPQLNYQARGLAVFAATAYPWAETGPFDPDPAKCTVHAAPQLITSDGSQPGTATVRLVDRNYQKIGGKAADITIHIAGGGLAVGPVVEVAEGLYQATLTGQADGDKLISVEVATSGGPVILDDTASVTVYTPGVSGPPIAEAGPDRTVVDNDGDGTESVVLDGSGSNDPDGQIADYVWIEGRQQIATGPAPAVQLGLGAHLIRLEVTDEDGWSDCDEVWVLVRAQGYNAKAVELDLSAGFNVDMWCGPKEYQAVAWYDELHSADYDLCDLQGKLNEGACFFDRDQQRFFVSNTSEYGFGEPYSIQYEWFHPAYKTGDQGTPEDGYLAGAEVDYFIASTLGSPLLPGDWTEVPEPVTGGLHDKMDIQPNAMLVGQASYKYGQLGNVIDVWLSETEAELPPDQQRQYWSVNFVCGGASDAADKQIIAVYTDGSEEILWTFDATTPPIGRTIPPRPDNPDFNLLYTFQESYGYNRGPRGAIGGSDYFGHGKFYEFAAALPLDPYKKLKAIRLIDAGSPPWLQYRGAAVFAATAIPVDLPELEIGEAQFDTVNNLMYFDLSFANTSDLPDLIGGFGASASLSGADVGHFTAAPDEVRNKLGTEMEALVNPAPYAWTTFLFPVVANSTAPETMAFGQNAWFPGEHVALDSLAEGTVVARFYYEWDGVEVSEVCVTIESYAQIDPGPVFTTGAGDVLLGTVINDGQNILVPAAGDPAITIAVQDDLDWIYQNTANSMSNGGHMISLTVTVTDLNGNNDVSVTVEKLPGSGAGEVTILDDPGGDGLVKYISGGMRSDGLAGTGALALRVTATGDVAGQATVDLPFTVRPLGDVDGNGAPEPGDVTVLILDLNGAPPPGYNARAFDLDANGAAEPGDVQILINILNALPVP